MKKYFFLMLLACVSFTAKSQNCGDLTGYNYSPTSLSPGDSVDLNLQVYCYENIYLDHYNISQTGQTVNIDAYYCHCCLQVITTTNDSIRFGFAGNDDIIVELTIWTGVYDMVNGICDNYTITGQETDTLTVTANSVNEINPSNIDVFPNPSDGKINFRTTENISSVTIINQFGQIVYQDSVLPSELNFSSGMYFITLQNTSGNYLTPAKFNVVK
jgi:hypothetical protein